MTLFQAALLALVQGVTEFLPISSSAHLILLPHFLGWELHSLTFDVVTNAATLLAAVIYFRRDLVKALREGGGQLRRGLLRGGPRPGLARPGLILALGVATVPLVLVGLFFYGWLSTEARRPEIIAATSIGFGLLLALADRMGRRVRRLESLSWKDSVIIGTAQAMALVPGTSRSGVTMTAALGLGFGRLEAARFSFLLAIPAGLLALAKDLYETWQAGTDLTWAPLLVGFGVAGLSAYLMIGWLIGWLERQDFSIFVAYRVLLGLIILLSL